MNNKKLLLIVGIINVFIIFMLIDKQNKIIKELYELQRLQEEKNIIFEENQELILQLHKEKELSSVESYIKNNLQMNKIALSDIKRLPESDNN